MGVQRIPNGILVPVPGEIDVADLAHRVHAGICAPGPLHARLFAAKRLERLRQHALHRKTVILDLPADERPAIIFDGELVAGHGGT
jgi:hypothetical protein